VQLGFSRHAEVSLGDEKDGSVRPAGMRAAKNEISVNEKREHQRTIVLLVPWILGAGRTASQRRPVPVGTKTVDCRSRHAKRIQHGDRHEETERFTFTVASSARQHLISAIIDVNILVQASMAKVA
jgi:hypothetical protein